MRAGTENGRSVSYDREREGEANSHRVAILRHKGLAHVDFQAGHIDDGPDLNQEVDANNAVHLEPVTRGTDLDLEIARLHIAERQAIQAFGEDKLAAARVANAPDRILWFQLQSNQKELFSRKNRSARTRIQQDVLQDDLPTAKIDRSRTEWQPVLQSYIHTVTCTPNQTRSEISRTSRLVWRT